MTKTTERRTLREFRRDVGGHDNPQVVEEHGGRWVTCTACGAIWSVAFDGAGHPLFEDVEPGDGTCPTR